MDGLADAVARGAGKDDGINAFGRAGALDAAADDDGCGIEATVAACWASVACDSFSAARAAAWSMRTGKSFANQVRVSSDASGSRD